ncbi:MAG: transcription-repair coupling factor [Bacteroidetes bacterium]|nr:transcription-repair coupling factor [Bacteroidota bacterium]
MNTRDILHRFGQTEPVRQLQQLLLSSDSNTVYLEGICGSGPAMILSSLFLQEGCPALVILPDKEEALHFKTDLENMLPGEHILFLPDSCLKPYKMATENAMSVQERIETLNALRKKNRRLIVSYGAAVAELVVESAELEKNAFDIQRGQQLSLDFLLEFLQENGFEREDFTFEPGQFSLRGGIVDVFSFAHEHPFRIELDGDVIESIRTYDVNSQLSLKEMAAFTLVPDVQQEGRALRTADFFSYISQDCQIWVVEPGLQTEELALAWEKALQEHTTALDLGADKQMPDPRQRLLTPATLRSRMGNHRMIYMGGERPPQPFARVGFAQQPQPLFKRNFDLLTAWLKENAAQGIETLVFSENSRQIERLQTILTDLQAGTSFHPVYQGLSSGFTDLDAKLAFATEHQLFDKYYRPRSRQRYSSNTALTLRELKNLKPGDYVTHMDHGIGRFAGLEKMEMNGVVQEAVRLVYKDNDLLYVSVNSLHKIARFSGKEGTVPTMHKLGSPAWEKQKKATKKKVKDIARELISLYARRKNQKGFAYAPDNYLQLELEASFFYEDTPDQAKATEDVKRDMEDAKPMDRLVCGDVGFGKTEVAMRAAFKAVCDSKQVAVLVPTTILAQQHYRTFSKRFAGFPVTVEYLNRFKSAKEQKDTLKKVKEGKVDVLIGTHRLLGKDLEFKDLGLLIIDEEQKFGVGAKEKLKELRVNVDTLTLTATPIPRTLHFSLMGARDLSVINTAPPNRQPVHTELHTFNREIIAEAVSHEIHRGGQVFFIHSRVKDIHEMAHMIEDAVPGARVVVAHGQMEGHQLEDAMVRFVEGEFDVLVATTIIESGLDIANANTIIINNAHMFGLSDLHQMRGRVGRSNVKAYCYLLSPPLSVLPEDARKRLRTITEYNELGSGFQVAMRDLDIRGAGNLLGGEQSGFINEMGFEMYHKILDEAVRELKHEEFNTLFEEDETDVSSRECQVETDYEMLIPSDYVSNIAERLSLYSELSDIDQETALLEFGDNLRDRFGKIPEPVIRLMDTMRLKWAGKKLGIEKITLNNSSMRLYFPGDPAAAIYSSTLFDRIMQHVAESPHKYILKQTDKALILTVRSVETVFEAIYVIQNMETGAQPDRVIISSN